MSDYPLPLQRLMGALEKLPGIGTRSAERLAFYLLKADRDEALALAQSVKELRESLQPCRVCFNFSEADMCPVCADPERDRGLVMVVESPKDLVAFERIGRFGGTYHVLMGHLSPHEGSAMRHLTVDRLMERIEGDGVREVVIATNPDAEGDATALALERRLAGTGVSVTRLARGLPTGFSIAFAGTEILAEALEGRRASTGEEG